MADMLPINYYFKLYYIFSPHLMNASALNGETGTGKLHFFT